ncbi:competence/damage-inducible protein A [Trichloromonas acetexigens]|uniref:competence/damage-inducible protein A n=1 Tax=Trichloromonas acetexigens TaxID=38815 RepID=UPI001F118CE6|nr:competence/damage-inducible protein A [Desulfuromonas acetexigens]
MEVNVSVLTIGDELLNGELSDTNTAAVARRLAAHGYRVRESLCVRDEMDDIVAALQLMADRRAVLIVTGGLGPTADDLTAEAAATAFGRPLEENPAAQEEVRAYFLRHNLTMHPRNDKQARLPVGVEILTNRLGTAPGFRLDTGHCDCFFLPGVPTEMVAMLDEAVLPRLERNHGEGLPTRERVLKVFGLSEPKCEALLVAAGLPEKVQVAFGVDFPFVHVKLRASGSEAETLLDRTEPVARRALGDFVVATGDASLAQTVARLLTEQRKTLALAESCTGGWIAKQLTDLPGASAFLERGAVTYANSAKRDWLKVPEAVLETQGAVSAECARAMAKGIREAAQADVALSVTGIAGPDGGTPGKPVGTVFIGLATASGEEVKGYRFSGDRDTVRRLSVCMALDRLRRYLEKH